LDIPRTLENLSQSPANIVALRRVEVLTTSVYPQVVDSTPYLETVRNFTSTPLVFKGYDPYLDQTVTWTTDRETLTTWLEIDNEGLSVREETFAPFVEAQTNSLRAQHPEPRYIQTEEAIELLRQALANQHEIGLRIRYEPQDYTVQAGDTASRVARKTGIPFYLLMQKNSGRNLDLLSIGDILELPSKDVTMPYAPNPNKRIVVDLDEQWLVAYESGQPVFSWSISTGIENAPTSPGIYQVLGHAEKAFGSSYNLCDDLGCGQWEMSWFMGIYEVIPGLVNGFHGAVILPDGTYLNGNRVGTPYTFGCVMSENSQAEQLYRWAEQGTVVEIISSEFAPVSQTAIQYKAQGT
jgi:lipoprotein-anchoring transpeptidase ErfK/SrfK